MTEPDRFSGLLLLDDVMVIRVSVPASLVPRLKIRNVVGMYDGDRFCALEILNAYYDKEGQPNAMPDLQ